MRFVLINSNYRVVHEHIIYTPPLKQSNGKIGLVKVPNIAGKWDGHLTSSFDDHPGEIKAAIEIKQTWTKLQITLETETSVSRSETASILTKIPDTALLSYEYVNEPKSHARSGMQIHRGTAKHEYQVNNKY